MAAPVTRSARVAAHAFEEAAPAVRQSRFRAAAGTGVALAVTTLLLAACGSGVSLDEPIEGPSWRLVQLGDQPVPPGADPRGDAQVRFDGAGRVSGSGGCNRMSGTYQRSGNDLRLGQLAATKMACAEPERNSNESGFFIALQTTASYRMQGAGRMTLLDAAGRTLATLEAGAAR